MLCQYSPEVKTRLVLKAYDVIHNGRLEFDAGWTDVAQSLMAIRKTMTASGRQMTRCARSAGDSAAVLLDLGRQLVGVLPRLGGDVAKRSQAGRMPLRLLCRRRWMPVSVVAWSTHGVIDARADPSNSTSI